MRVSKFIVSTVLPSVLPPREEVSSRKERPWNHQQAVDVDMGCVRVSEVHEGIC